MLTFVNAARATGVSDSDLKAIFKASSISKQHIRSLLRGDADAPKWKIGKTFMKGSVKRAKLLIDKETAAMIKARSREIRARARQEQ